MRAVIEESISDQVLAPDQQSRALRPAHCFAAAESDEIVTHVGVVPKVRHRGRIRSSVVHAWNVVLLAELHPLVDFDLSGRIGKI